MSQLSDLAQKENVNLETLGFEEDVAKSYQALITPIEIAGERLGTLLIYKANEQYDGYQKDKCVFADDIDIYDTMSLNVEYDGVAIMSYCLNATAAYEGWKIVFNGSKGRMEAIEYETGFQAKCPDNTIKVFDLDNNMTEYHVTKGGGGHGGGDERLRAMIFRDNVPDPLGHRAGTMDGAYSILVGVAANKSIKEGRIVSIDELLDEKFRK